MILESYIESSFPYRFTFHRCTCPSQVINTLTKCNSIDGVLTDIHMPEMDGIELTAQIKDRFPDLKIIGVTGDPDCQSLRENKSFSTIITKPFERKDIKRAVEECFINAA